MFLTRLTILVALIAPLPALAAPAQASNPAPTVAHNPKPFGLWVMEFKDEAVKAGVTRSLLDRAFNNMMPDNSVVELDRKQPEGTKTFTQYLEGAVTDSRIRQGRELYQTHRALLDKISSEFGVQPQFIVALWGIETNFGGYTGNFSVVQSLATLAYDGRRSDFFRSELLKALQIIHAGHISLSEMEGSWAGAMGQCQFMPSSFLNFAVDYNKDGRKDIWNTLPDVFASIANYLKQSGWNDQLTWGRAVRLPATFDVNLADGKQFKPLSQWQAMGVRTREGTDLPNVNANAAITLPGKPHETAYLMYSNYDVILKWNRSRYFATAVGTLADEIAR